MGKEHQNESDPNPVFEVDLQGRVRPDTGNVGSDIGRVVGLTRPTANPGQEIE